MKAGRGWRWWGPEFPLPLTMLRPNGHAHSHGQAFTHAIKFYTEAMMANQMQWCVAGVPTAAWAQRVYPHLDEEAALAALWQDVLQFVHADQPDPVAEPDK